MAASSLSTRARHLTFQQEFDYAHDHGRNEHESDPSNVQTVLGNVRLADGNTPLWSMTTAGDYPGDAHFGIEVERCSSILSTQRRRRKPIPCKARSGVAPTPDTDTDVKLDVA